MSDAAAMRLIHAEASALLARLAQVKPFALHLPMVMAAAPTIQAWAAIEKYLASSRRDLRRAVHAFHAWLRGSGRESSPAHAQRRLAFLRMQVLAGLNQFDLFADALVQRSQHGFGEWLGGLDVAAADAIDLPSRPYESPPVICYLDRGHGAAIRRARTRLPGGGDNPVAIIQMPRERMLGSGIASSLVHEVGHQSAALLDLVNPLRAALNSIADQAGPHEAAWRCFQRWISEIIADFWSVARIGIGSTLGLMGVCTLPRPFLFRVSLDDPHPTPWVRVVISATIGKALFPDPQWDQLIAVWERLYPLAGLDDKRRALFDSIRSQLPRFVSLVCDHKPEILRGATLLSILPRHDRTPAALRQARETWLANPEALAETRPTVAFAAIGQAKADGKIGGEDESRLIGRLLRYWAYRSTVNTTEMCAQARRQHRAVALST